MDKDINKDRNKIDKIDKAIIELLGERKRIAESLILSKKEKQLPVEDLERENKIVENLQKFAQNLLSPELVSEIYSSIFKSNKINFLNQEITKSDLFNYIKSNKFLISGPCAIESLEQIDKTAEELNNIGVKFLRGGCFKPRTSPDSFQGLGAKALEYLIITAKKYGMYSVSEITSIHQFELGFENIDIIQIGTRNAMNFELLKYVGKYTARTQKPILLKRGFSMTISEYISAANYIISEGNNSVILCLRGIRTFEQINSEFRFTPDLASILELKSLIDLSVIFDPSHSSGDKKFVIPLALAALSMGADGLTIESHCSPESALSDAKQCVHPKSLIPIIDKIK